MTGCLNNQDDYDDHASIVFMLDRTIFTALDRLADQLMLRPGELARRIVADVVLNLDVEPAR